MALKEIRDLPDLISWVINNSDLSYEDMCVHLHTVYESVRMTKRRFAKPPKLVIPSPVLYANEGSTDHKSIQSIQSLGYSTTIPMRQRRSMLDAFASSYGHDYVLHELNALLNHDPHNFAIYEKVEDDILYVQRKYNPTSTT